MKQLRCHFCRIAHTHTRVGGECHQASQKEHQFLMQTFPCGWVSTTFTVIKKKQVENRHGKLKLAKTCEMHKCHSDSKIMLLSTTLKRWNEAVFVKLCTRNWQTCWSLEIIAKKMFESSAHKHVCPILFAHVFTFQKYSPSEIVDFER